MAKSELYDFGMVGLGVMGRNFSLNVLDHDFSVSGLDNNQEQLDALKKEAVNKDVFVTKDTKVFVLSLKRPRKIMLLVPAGDAVDTVIQSLLPYVEMGDVIIDGGNSHFTDTDRRIAQLRKSKIAFIGMGVSGGAKGARFGPSIMVGGTKTNYNKLKKILEAVAAKHKEEPCVALLGEGSAGNYVKMVHNGIEYAMMQLIAESYDVLAKIGGLSNKEIHKVFKKYNKGRLQSYLIEITSNIFNQKDSLSKGLLIDKILDQAKQKGTGKWVSQNALDIGVSIPSIDTSVSMRILSSIKDDRKVISKKYKLPFKKQKIKKRLLVDLIEEALYFSFLMTFEQGLYLLSRASIEYKYNLDMKQVIKVWRNGCIIRARLLDRITKTYEKEPKLEHIILDNSVAKDLEATHKSMRKIVKLAISSGIPVLNFSASLAYFDGLRSKNLPLNLTQAQRDYFGSHGFNLKGKDGIFHIKWK